MNRRGFLNRAAAFLATMLMPWRKPLTDADADIVVWYDAEGKRHGRDLLDFRRGDLKKSRYYETFGNWARVFVESWEKQYGKRAVSICLGKESVDRKGYSFIRSITVTPEAAKA